MQCPGLRSVVLLSGEAPVRYKVVRQSLRNGAGSMPVSCYAFAMRCPGLTSCTAAGFEFPIDSDVLKGGGLSTVVTDLEQDDQYAFKVSSPTTLRMPYTAHGTDNAYGATYLCARYSMPGTHIACGTAGLCRQLPRLRAGRILPS
eukprot:3548746-Rhodomonas_salina.6